MQTGWVGVEDGWREEGRGERGPGGEGGVVGALGGLYSYRLWGWDEMGGGLLIGILGVCLFLCTGQRILEWKVFLSAFGTQIKRRESMYCVGESVFWGVLMSSPGDGRMEPRHVICCVSARRIGASVLSPCVCEDV